MPQSCYMADTTGTAQGDIGGVVPSWRKDASGNGHQVATSNNPCAENPPGFNVGNGTASPNVNQLAIANLYPYANVVGSSLFINGTLVPGLELAHHPWRNRKTYEDYLGKKALRKSRWKEALEQAPGKG